MVGDIFHICNRGINKNKVFFEIADYFRFVECLYKFNNKGGSLRNESENFFVNPPKQNKIVEILKWSLLPNHYHLLVYEIVDGGTINFVKRLGNGYTKYINIKNERSGYLFQNRAKMIQVKTDKHFLYIPFYIEMNPLDLHLPGWKEIGISKPQKALDFLEKYRWSSYRDYSDSENFPLIINKELYFDQFSTNRKKYSEEIRELITKKKSLPLTCEVDGWW